ncbi:hypothetical protein CANMA_004741 [Candida margitis]|uniref:uncharacterized protein n=1 Tax=Candida margitis TaxID=1775924 RepID=UPI00222647F2|nr:uncharacterized protein CANMA_004741 [Candida margitis]KAI5953902.1 hypothetical protein CANMA_004741 [Candida margitis]
MLHPTNESTAEYTSKTLKEQKLNYYSFINATRNINDTIFTIQGKDKVPKWSFSTGIFANKAQDMGYQDCREIAKYKKRPITIIETEPVVEEPKPMKKKPKKSKMKPEAPPEWLLDSSSSEDESDIGEKEMNLTGSESDEDSDVSENEGKLWFLGLSSIDKVNEGKIPLIQEDALVTKVGKNYPGLYFHRRASLENYTYPFHLHRNHQTHEKRRYTDNDYLDEADDFQREEDKFKDKIAGNFEIWQVKLNARNASSETEGTDNSTSTSISFNELSHVHTYSESKASRLWCILGLYCF